MLLRAQLTSTPPAYMAPDKGSLESMLATASVSTPPPKHTHTHTQTGARHANPRQNAGKHHSEASDATLSWDATLCRLVSRKPKASKPSNACSSQVPMSVDIGPNRAVPLLRQAPTGTMRLATPCEAREIRFADAGDASIYGRLKSKCRTWTHVEISLRHVDFHHDGCLCGLRE